MKLEIVNKLYLELSQVATATTARELALMKEIAEIKTQRDDLIADLAAAQSAPKPEAVAEVVAYRIHTPSSGQYVTTSGLEYESAKAHGWKVEWLGVVGVIAAAQEGKKP